MALSAGIHGGGRTVVIDERPRSEVPGLLIVLLSLLFLTLFLLIVILLSLGQSLRLLGDLVIGVSRWLGKWLGRFSGPLGAAIIHFILGIRTWEDDNQPPEPPSSPPADPLPMPVLANGPRRGGGDAQAVPVDLPCAPPGEQLHQ